MRYRMVVILGAFVAMAANVYAAGEVDSVMAALGIIIMTNIGTLGGIIYMAGSSMQRLRQLETDSHDVHSWMKQHEEWADSKLDQLPHLYASKETIDARLTDIGVRLEKIEEAVDALRCRRYEP